MNVILQKRIEKAAGDYSVSWIKNPDGSEFRELFPVAAKRSFIAGANFALQNQWIPVEEALPPRQKTTKGEELEQSIHVFVRDNEGNYTSAWYSFYSKHWFMGYGEAFLKQSIYSKITHWMAIPSLKGGKK